MIRLRTSNREILRVKRSIPHGVFWTHAFTHTLVAKRFIFVILNHLNSSSKIFPYFYLLSVGLLYKTIPFVFSYIFELWQMYEQGIYWGYA